MRSRDVIAAHAELPEHEVIRLVMAATRRSRSEVVVGFDLTDDEVARFMSYLERRVQDEPLQYIEGTVDFGPVEVSVDPRVLVPRPETEYILTQAIEAVDAPAIIVDLCTGSGNLALGLAATFPAARVYAVDLSEDAVAVATLNAERTGLTVEVLVGDLFDPLPESIRGRVDLLVSNPPYLAHGEVADLPADVLAEPRMALVAGERGDEVVERIAAGAFRWLAPGGVVVCEISEFESQRSAAHFSHLDGVVRKDLTGRDRFVIGHRRFD
ncbi:MAG: peptide chain release factor N(5)-glutamine methyltransferase [Actinomycetota bacterium]